MVMVVWPYLAVYGWIWLYMAVDGCIWPYMGCIWLEVDRQYDGSRKSDPFRSNRVTL